MRRGLTLVLLVVLPGFAFCQDYAVTMKGDTVRGDIRVFTYDQMDRVQVGNGKSKESFTAVQVRYLWMGGKPYQPVKMDTQIRMMEVLSAGFLSLYGFRMANQSSYDGRYLVKIGGQSLELPNLTFKKTMSAFLKDCTPVVKKIESGAWGKKELDSILFQYNNCVEEKSIPKAPNEGVLKLQDLKKKIEASDLAGKKDALDLVNDIIGKVDRKEVIPNYLTEGLKSYLNGKPEFTEDLAAIMQLIKN
jgi:hypothetical protein